MDVDVPVINFKISPDLHENMCYVDDRTESDIKFRRLYIIQRGMKSNSSLVALREVSLTNSS